MKVNILSSSVKTFLVVFVLSILLISAGCLSVYHEKFIRASDYEYPKLDKNTRIPIYETDFPNVQFIGQLQAAYEGSDEEIAKQLANRARKLGANVIMNYKEKEKVVELEHKVPPRMTYRRMLRPVRRRNPDGSVSVYDEWFTYPVYEPGYTYRYKENLRLVQCDFGWTEDDDELPGDIFELTKLPKRFDNASVSKKG